MTQKIRETRTITLSDEIAGDFQTFASEVDEDKRGLRVAMLVAVIFHVGMFAIHFHELAGPVLAEPKKDKAVVMKTFRFQPPENEPIAKVVDPPARRVAIPDPTPNEPEPIRMMSEVEPELDLRNLGTSFELPERPPSPEPDGPIVMTSEVVPPVKIYAPSPQYTELARRIHTEGVVIVQAVIDRQGRVTKVTLLKGLPMGLDQAALEAVRQWRFEAALLHGKPISVFYTLTIHFSLQ